MTHTAKHTPGPWTQDGLFIVAENGDVSVPICDCDVENFLDEAQANAHLIAAAPAMYEALKNILALQLDCDGVTVKLTEFHCHQVREAQAALAQAEARS